MNIRVEYGFGPLIAAIAAGPVFCTALILGLAFEQLPQAIPVDVDAVLFGPFMLIPATFVGTLLAIVPCFIGCALMAHLGRFIPAARAAPAWAVAGLAVIVAGFAVSGGEAGTALFAFLATGASCALICRRFTKWSEAPDWMPKASARVAATVGQGAGDQRLLR